MTGKADVRKGSPWKNNLETPYQLEMERFRQRSPKSLALHERGTAVMPNGVPATWMVRWTYPGNSRCREYGVQQGGRTPKPGRKREYLFLDPDFVVVGKSIAGGIPMGVYGMRDEIAATPQCSRGGAKGRFPLKPLSTLAHGEPGCLGSNSDLRSRCLLCHDR